MIQLNEIQRALLLARSNFFNSDSRGVQSIEQLALRSGQGNPRQSHR